MIMMMMMMMLRGGTTSWILRRRQRSSVRLEQGIREKVWVSIEQGTILSYLTHSEAQYDRRRAGTLTMQSESSSQFHHTTD